MQPIYEGLYRAEKAYKRAGLMPGDLDLSIVAAIVLTFTLPDPLFVYIPFPILIVRLVMFLGWMQIRRQEG